MTIAGWIIDGGAVVLGAINGIVYGLLAIGLVLAYRSSRVINFAHGEVGAFAAAVMAIVSVQLHMPYWIALALAVAVGAGMSATIEMTVVNRLRAAPRVLTIVATLGAGAFLTALAFVVNASAGSGMRYPQPAGLPTFTIGALQVTPARTGMLVLGPLAMALVALFLRRTRYGTAIRAAAANPESASTIGISPRRMSTLAWGLAGALAALTAALVIPTRGAAIGEAFGAELLVRALVAAVVARMTRFGVAAAVGLAIGVVEQVIAFNSTAAGSVEMALFVLIAVGLAAQRREGSRLGDREAWSVTDALPPLPDWLEQLWLVRNRGWVLAAVLVPIAAILPAVVSAPAAFTLSVIAAFAIVGVSVGLLTGLLGQLTFGQFAVAGVGAALAIHASLATGQFLVGLLVGAAAGALISVVVGLPGVRLRGPLLAVVTLGFALASRWLFQRDFLFGAGLSPGGARFGPVTISGSRSYAYLALAALLGVLWVARNVRSSWFGRRLVALRDNEEAARAFAVPALRSKVQAYALSGAIAGLGGAVYAHGFSTVAQTDFPVSASIDVVALTVLGGVGTLIGPVLGALYIIGVPRFLPLDSAGLAASQIGWLLLVLYLPGGIAMGLRPVRDRLALWYAKRVGWTAVPERVETVETAETADGPPDVADEAPVVVPRWGGGGASVGPAALRVVGVEKSYGGVHAVAGVDLHVEAGEILGLIGPNGAGKTTLFEIISGFTTPDAGTVVLDGEDVSVWSPERRAAHGLVRSFQDAAMFSTMTVEQAVRLALDSRGTSGWWAAVRGDHADRAAAEAAVMEVLSAAGLGRYRGTAVGALSTGTRRICELACLAVLRPRILLLDEPSSGIAQREVEALGPLIRNLARTLETSIVVIEHDIPLIRSVADRLVVMAAGSVLAEGEPGDVLADPAVVEAYLGGSSVAVQRSGVA